MVTGSDTLTCHGLSPRHNVRTEDVAHHAGPTGPSSRMAPCDSSARQRRIAAGAVPGQRMRGAAGCVRDRGPDPCRQIAHNGQGRCLRSGLCGPTGRQGATRRTSRGSSRVPRAGTCRTTPWGRDASSGRRSPPVRRSTSRCGVRPRQALSADRGDPMTAGLHAAGQGGACRSVIACQSVQDQRQRQVRVDGRDPSGPCRISPRIRGRPDAIGASVTTSSQPPATGTRSHLPPPSSRLSQISTRAQAGQIGDALRVGRRARIGQGAGPRTCLVRMTDSQQARVGKEHLRLGVRPWAVGSRVLARCWQGVGILFLIIYVKYIHER